MTNDEFQISAAGSGQRAAGILPAEERATCQLNLPARRRQHVAIVNRQSSIVN